LFRRSKPPADLASEATITKPGGKGRPTPTRREAEAAARARAKTPRTRKERVAAGRADRAENSAKMRQALKTGDDRHLPARDKGPVRRFIRDLVDSRLSFMELMLPILLLSMVLGYLSPVLQLFSNMLVISTLILVTFDMIRLRFRLKKELATRFPGEDTSGSTYYAMMRSLQVRFFRMPKAITKIGQQLPEHYR
jgi:Protein of unknown function (DUF3043)